MKIPIRRALALTLPVLGLAALAGCASTHTAAKSGTGTAGVMTADDQKALTPDMVIADLKAGNERFVAARATRGDNLAQVRATAAGQYPKAIILSCLDSRVIPEVVFDQAIGDLFVGRVAGNFETPEMLGSMEFGTAAAGAKAIVVLGHTACGAVKGAIDDVRLGNLTTTLSHIRPVALAVEPGSQGRTSKDSSYVNAVAEENVRRTVADIQQRSPVLADLVAKGQLKIVGGMYDLSTGEVTWIN